MHRVWGAVAGLALLCLSAVVGVVGGSQLAESEVDNSLTARSLETATSIEEYFERSRAIALLIADTPSFVERFEHPRAAQSGAVRPGHHTHTAPLASAVAEETRRIEAVLENLEKIYPTQIGEACVINRDGVEVARVVRGDPAPMHELSHEEGDNEFFHAAFALDPGEVYQSAPYVSPDTGEWVISNATPIATADGHIPAIAHFEITVDSFREQAEVYAAPSDIMVVDRSTGRILIQTGDKQELGAPLGKPATSLSKAVAESSERSAVVTVDDRRLSFRAIRPAEGNQNDWIVVASAEDSASPWSTGPGKGAIAAALGALVLLASSLQGLRTHQRNLRRQATTDELTGLANRAVLHQRLKSALRERRASGMSALLLLDLDGFKDVNDTLGHSSGDILLREVAERIRGQVRSCDLAARLGGDEFALLLDSVADDDGLRAAAHRVLEAIRLPFRLDGVGMHLNASIGVAVVGRHGHTPETLIQRADIAMYQAKAAHAGVVFYAPEKDPHSARRLGMTAGLLEAIQQRTIDLHYQPQIDLTTGSVTGVEALIRWVHPELGPLTPCEFIPMAEKTGLIRLLTGCVLDQALAQCRHWLDEGLRLQVAVNCSAVDLADERLVQEVADRLSTYELPAELLKLEITESALMADVERGCNVLRRLHEMGVSLSIDDYGTGYASLAYLRTLPVSELKIDRAFVSGTDEGSVDAVIVSSTIALGHRLGLQVVAEGVEDDAVLGFLRAAGCDSAQGFHFGPPLPPQELVEWLGRYERDGGSAHQEPGSVMATTSATGR